MSNRPYAAAALFAALAFLPATPAFAAVILITHAKALAGNVTAGDAPGYPVTLTVPGSFQLDSNLFVAANEIGIQVTSKNVTIDLNGFTIEGSETAWHGITGSAGNVTLKNGTITRFEFDAITNAGSQSYWVVENMRIIANGRYGFRTGSYSSVRGSTVVANGLVGIACGGRCLIETSTVSANSAAGIVIASGSVLGNVIIGNAGFGIDGGQITGFGNNTLYLNNNAGAQVDNVTPLQPNACNPACP
jgi:hypothetical protein